MLRLSEIYITLLHCHCPWREWVKCIVVSEWQEWKQGKFTCKMNQPRTWHQQCWFNTYAVPIGNDDAIADDNAYSDAIAHITHHRRWCTSSKLVYFLAGTTHIFGLFLACWAILTLNCALFGVYFEGLNNAVAYIKINRCEVWLTPILMKTLIVPTKHHQPLSMSTHVTDA